VRAGIVALLLVLGAFLGWWIVQRDPVPLELLAAEQGRSWAPILARVSVLCFVSALLSLLRPRWLPRAFRPPARWFRSLVLTAAITSALLFLLYLGPWSILPLAIDAVLAWGLLAQGWSVESLRGMEASADDPSRWDRREPR
jgi:hypothetical protein